MAQPVNFVNKNTNQVRQGYMGFSWTALFWGPFPAAFRSDWKWFVIILIAGIATAGLSGLVFCFIYNKQHIKTLIQEGFSPEGSEDFLQSVYAYAGMQKPTS
jgi:hypothetical protein